MRIVSWNVNGQRTLRGYRPWYSMKSWAACLDHLDADIICFQEVKMTRKAVLEHRDMCLAEGYEAYYSLHPTKGYSGVSTFVKKAHCDVLRAEMGITGELVENRRGANKDVLIGGYPDEHAPESPLYDLIDSEGRAVLVDCGLFVLFNLYCPNETDEGRRDYKMAFYHTLAERVDNLLRMGREVIIVGDMNIAHLPIDHCEGVNQRTRDEHLSMHPARQWLDRFLAPQGAFHDVTRMHHRTRKFMYTCWDTVKDTRPANYGVRIDYVFVSPGLLPWVKFADIQPSIFGSDHCPIYVDLHDEIEGSDGRKIHLRDHLKVDANIKRKPPPIATSSWPEFAGRRIQSFFTPSASKNKLTPSPSPVSGVEAQGIGILSVNINGGVTAGDSVSSSSQVSSALTSQSDEIDPALSQNRMPPSPPQAQKTIEAPRERRKISQSRMVTARGEKSALRGKKGQRATESTRSEQTGIRSFLRQPKTLDAVVPSGRSELEQDLSSAASPSRPDSSTHASPAKDEVKKRAASEVDEADAYPVSVAEEQENGDDDSGAERVKSALAWGSIFAPIEPPRCSEHGEPARAWTVNKTGPNHGRKFWMCARPVGSSGTGSAADDRRFRCGYWKWDSDVRKRQRRQDRDVDGSARSFHDVAGTAPRLGSGERRGPEKLDKRPMHKAAVPREKK